MNSPETNSTLERLSQYNRALAQKLLNEMGFVDQVNVKRPDGKYDQAFIKANGEKVFYTIASPLYNEFMKRLNAHFAPKK